MRAKIEQEPQERENIYYKLFNLIEQAIQICELVWDEKGEPVDIIILNVNPSFEKHSGLRREQVVGRHIKEILPIVEQIWLERYAEVIRSGKETHFEEYNTSLEKWLEVSTSPIGGNRFVAVFKDVTERKKKEMLCESDENFCTLFNSINEGYCIVKVIFNDRGKPVDLLMLDYNSAFEQQTGITFDTKGKTFRSVFPKYKDQRIADIGKVALTGKPARFENYDQLLNRWYTGFAFRIGGEGSFLVALIFNDVSRSKQAEETLKRAKETLEEKVRERTAELEKAYYSLKESEKGLSEAQKMAHIGNWVWDIETDEAYWSDELYRIFGRDPQKLAPTINEFYNYIHPEDRHNIVNLDNKALNEKSSLCKEFRILTDVGEERIVYMQSEIIFDEKNIPIRINGIVQDITERKRAEEKIKDLANIVESSEDAIGTISLDGIITSWNKGAEKVYGYSAEEILGKHVSILSPSHLDNETMKLIELIRQGENYHQYETLGIGKNKNKIYVSITYSPILDSNGKLTAVSIIGRDITERKEAEKKLRESEEKYRTIVETANEGIGVIDNELKLTYVNKKLEEMLGYSSEEIVGKNIWSFLGEQSKPVVKSILERGLQDFENPELEYMRKNGSTLRAQVNAKPIYDEGKFKGIMTMITDISKRKEAEEALAKIEIARKQEIHHRIKNNLQVISSLLDLQAEHFRNKECIKESEILEAFRESQDRVISMALIHEELHKGGKVDTLNFSHYIKELADNLFLTYRFGNGSIGLNTDIEEDISFDMDIAIPLGIIINELVSNSLKHAFTDRDNGKIHIKLHREKNEECKNKECKTEECKTEECKNDECKNGECKNEEYTPAYVLMVSDNGVGIPANLDIENLDSLGMQLVTSLVDQLDGEFELKSKSGTGFTMRFKVAEKDRKN